MRRSRLRSLAVASLALLAIGCRERADVADGPYSDRLAEYIPKIERSLGLTFKTPPKIEVRTRDQVREFLIARLNEPKVQSELAGQGAVLSAMGMISDSLDLRTYFIPLLTEQILGYYDPRTKTLYVVEGAPEEYAGLTIMHELVHALQDQYVNLDSLQNLVGDDDRVSAAQAVIEGQATYEQAALMAGGEGNLAVALPGGWNRIRDAIREAQATQPLFANAPMVIQETLLFPYINGADYIRRFRSQRKGQSPLSDMPVSTEQLLHDSAFFATPRDVPTMVSFPDPAGAVHGTALGEFGTRLFLYHHTRDVNGSASAASGWDGDRVVAVSTPAGKGFVWVTVWDTPFDAAEFASAAGAAVGKRHSDSTSVRDGDIRRFTVPGRTVSIAVSKIGGRDAVVMIDLPGTVANVVDPARVILR